MARSMQIIDTDKGFKRIEREISRSFSSPHVVVGIYGNKASAIHEDTKATVGQIASYHEFGLGNPERSFIRSTVDEKTTRIAAMAKRLMGSVIDGHQTTHKALDLLGAYIHGQIIANINRGIPPANAPSTVARKGSSKPLVDTGQLKGSISWEVRSA